MSGRGALADRDFGRSHCGTGITVDHHWEPLRESVRWGDPHDRRGALDLDDPEPKLS